MKKALILATLLIMAGCVGMPVAPPQDDVDMAERTAIGVGLVKITETDGTPSGWVKQVTVSNGSLAISGSDATLTTGGSGQAVTLDIGDDDIDESLDIGEIATTGDTNSIVTEPSVNKMLIDMGNNWPTADTANAGDSATAFFSAGTIEHEYGGLEADVSAYSGLVKIATGATSAVTVTTFGESLLDDANAAAGRTTLEVTATADDIIQTSSWTGGDLTGTGLAAQVNETGVDHDLLANSEPEEHYRWDNDISGTATIDVANLGATLADISDGTIAANLDFVGDVVFSEKADHSSTPGATKGYLWVKDTTPSTLIFTDDAGSDTTLGAGGGSGDITAVGPGYATGAAFTDGVESTGTTMFVWEGTADDTNELSIISPSANPGADIDITLPAATGTLVTSAEVLTLTNTDAFTPSADYHPSTKKYVDDNIAAGAVVSVGDSSSAAALDGTSDGGTQILFYDAQGATTFAGGDTSGAITLTLPAVATGTLYATGNTDVALADGGTGQSLADPGAADYIMFWDDSDSAVEWLGLGNGLTITTNTIAASVYTVDVNELTNTSGSIGLADTATARAAIGLEIGADVQAYDADLTTYAGITPSANVQGLLGAADYAAMRTLLDLEAGTDFYSISAADSQFEEALVNEAGLYSALSDVTMFLEDVVDDTTPQLGGALDVNSQEIQSAGDVVFQLGDAAGVFSLDIQDSGSNVVWSVDSDGNVTVSQGTAGQRMYVLEAALNGTDFRGWRVPDALTQSYNFEIPDGDPSANDIFLLGAPSGTGDDRYSALSYGSLSTDNFAVAAGSITIKDLGVSVAEINASGTPDGTTYLRGDGSWQAVSASAGGNDTEVQYNSSGSLAGDTGWLYNATNNTMSITQAASNPTIQTGDGTYVWGHTPQVGIEGVLEVDGAVFADGNLTVAGDLAVTGAFTTGDLEAADTNNEFAFTPDNEITDTLVIQARDIDGAAWDNLITLTNANTPTLAFLADGGVTTNSMNPNAVNTVALGSDTAEWAGIYLGDGAIIYGQNDQSNTLTSGATGWTAALAFTAPNFIPTGNAANAGEIGYNTNAFSWYANSENMLATAGTDLWTFSSGTAAEFAFTPKVYFGVGIDGVGAVDLDYGSADITDHTFVADGGTVVIDGTVTPGAAAATDGAIGYTGGAYSLYGGTDTFTITNSVNEWQFNSTGDVFSFLDNVLIGGTAQLRIPTAADPTTNALGSIALDSDDNFIEFYGDGVASRVVGGLYSETFSIVEPDTIQGITDDVVLKHFMADSYPHGVTIKDIAISSASAYTSEVFLIEEWSNRAGAAQTTVESITISSQYQEDDGTLSDSAIAADAFLVVNLDDTPEDIAMVEITVTYYINPGN